MISGPSPRVAIIGGGYAGMSAAVELTHRGVPVTVFEAARQLGGRARAVVTDGRTLDNGQHILIGAYSETLRMIARVANLPSDRLLHRMPLTVEYPGTFRLRAAKLPAPLHFGAALLTARGMSFEERWAVLRFLRDAQRQNFRLPQDCSVRELLASTRQPEQSCRRLWVPLCIAALNTPVEVASGQIFLNVLRESLLGTRAHSDFILPKTDLGSLFPDRAADWIKARGAELRLGTRVNRICHAEDQLGVETNGAFHAYSHVICATAPFRVEPLTRGLPALDDLHTTLSSLRYQPIRTVYLQYASDVSLPSPVYALDDGPGQWLFDRGALTGDAGLLAVVISADENITADREELVSALHRQLARHFPVGTAPSWSSTIIEKRATFSCEVGFKPPVQATAVAGLFLCGDYTDPAFPGTLESAVRSGVKCASEIVNALERRVTIN